MTERRRTLTSRFLLVAAGLLLLLTAVASSARAQITLRGTANPVINITTGTAGGAMTPVVNNTSTIRYSRAAKISKITVQATCPSQHFNLSVVAIGVTRGVAAPAVSLLNGMAAVDFITSIPNFGFTTSTPTLSYTASADFSDGNSAELGNDVYTVTYTQLAQ